MPEPRPQVRPAKDSARMSRTKLDRTDRAILTALQQDGRMTNAALAERIGLSQTPVLRRVKMLEQSGVITRYATVIDQEAAGLAVSVFVQVTLERQIENALEHFETSIAAYPEVMECYLMTGDSDYLLRIVAADLAAYERFLKEKLTRLKGIATIRSSFALKQIVYRTALPLPEEE
jgi:DNA-binding Lrp family transcriptional regulator